MAKKKTPVDRKRTYEESGKRPGTPIGTRVPDTTLKLIDARLEPKQSRSAWVLALINKEVGVNAPPTSKKKR